MLNFSTKTAIVTGGSRGIGKEISLILAKNNFNVVATATSEKSLDSIRDIENIHPFCSDISDEKSIEKLYEFVISKFGYADVLINNAGIHMDNILLRMKSEEWNQVMNVNLNGPFHLTKTVLKDMVKNKNGRIINISSISGTDGNKGQGNYAASKGGLLALTKSVAASSAITWSTVASVAERPVIFNNGDDGSGLPLESTIDCGSNCIILAAVSAIEAEFIVPPVISSLVRAKNSSTEISDKSAPTKSA